ncbi:hypothetical protein JL720_15674 [Aureococcus anophagefferens]|nr:hypothetical protein JL720_15674 [Aureococcus anophagefferens]
MPKPTESMDVNQYTRHKSYAYHNNLHHDAHRSTGPVLSVFGAEPRSASAPAQHEGEGILALLDPREPPCHYFAVVTQEFLTLSPLMMKGAVVSKGVRSRKYSGVEGSTKLDMKLVNSAKDEVARALETTANICLEEMKTAEEQGVKAARRSSRAVARKVKEKALAASDSAERLHQAMLDKKAGRRASSTVATPKTAAVVDTRLRHALNPAAVAPDAPSDAPFDYFPSAEVVRIPLAQVRQTEVAALRMTHGFDVAPGEADANDARLLVADLERSLCGGHDAEPESDSDDDDAVRTLRQRERDAKREQLLQRRGAELMRPDLPQRHGRGPAARRGAAARRAPSTSADVDAVATVSLGERDDGDDHDSLSAGSLDHSNRVRDAQLAVATRGLAAVRVLRAALHDSRGVSERFRLLRTHKLTPERIVDACSADHFNHTDHRDDAADARLRHDARVARHQAQHWTPHAFHLPSERKRRDANRELLAKSRENFLRNHLTPFFQNPVDAPTGETPDSRLETPKARLAFHPSTKGLERRDDASPADLAEAAARLVVDDDDDASVASSASRAPSSVSQASSGSSALFLAAQRMQRDEEAEAADKSDRLRRTLKEAADLEAAEDAKTSDAAARLVASLGRADSVKTLESGSSSRLRDLGAAVNDAPPPPSSSSSGPYAEETAFFVKDRDAAIAYSDIPPLPGAAAAAAVALFARLLDAQADLLVEIDELTSARFREDDPPIWVDMGQRQMGPHWVLSSVAPTTPASPLLCALVERCISLGLSISRTGPSLPSPSKRARARQVTAVGDLRSPRAGDRSSRGATEPALALLACSHLLLGLLQASYVMREIAASECADEVDDFLLRDEFYDALEANRVTRLAASNLREATRVIRQGEETAKAAHRKQRGGDITHT